jgi:hypothetical protein
MVLVICFSVVGEPSSSPTARRTSWDGFSAPPSSRRSPRSGASTPHPTRARHAGRFASVRRRSVVVGRMDLGAGADPDVLTTSLSRRTTAVAPLAAGGLARRALHRPDLRVSLARRLAARGHGEGTTDEPPGWLLALLQAGFPLMLLAGLLSVTSLFLRFRRARGDERQQDK